MKNNRITLADCPFGIVPEGITLLYQVGRLQLTREGLRTSLNI